MMDQIRRFDVHRKESDNECFISTLKSLPWARPWNIQGVPFMPIGHHDVSTPGVDNCSVGFLGFVRGTASIAERLGNINQTQIPNCTACLQTLTNKNDHCTCATLYLNV